MKQFVLFVLIFLFILLIYQMFILKRYKKGKTKKAAIPAAFRTAVGRRGIICCPDLSDSSRKHFSP